MTGLDYVRWAVAGRGRGAVALPTDVAPARVAETPPRSPPCHPPPREPLPCRFRSSLTRVSAAATTPVTRGRRPARLCLMPRAFEGGGRRWREGAPPGWLMVQGAPAGGGAASLQSCRPARVGGRLLRPYPPLPSPTIPGFCLGRVLARPPTTTAVPRGGGGSGDRRNSSHCRTEHRRAWRAAVPRRHPPDRPPTHPTGTHADTFIFSTPSKTCWQTSPRRHLCPPPPPIPPPPPRIRVAPASPRARA